MKKITLLLNVLLFTACFTGNYLYQTAGGLEIKAFSSACFALTGLVNLAYAVICRSNARFPAAMAAGLILAMLGDILLGFSFILGAGLFALGHVCFFIAQCVLTPFARRDVLFVLPLFAASALFLLLCPLLTFPDPLIHAVCIVYALIISLMTGKSISSLSHRRTAATCVLAAGCALFFFSDLMLVMNWFMDAGRIASRLCMAAYYPAECLLAFSAYVYTQR